LARKWTLNFAYKVYVSYTVRDFQHVKSSDGFTSLPKEVVLRIFFARVSTSEWVRWQARYHYAIEDDIYK
jgi:hypothetical protein